MHDGSIETLEEVIDFYASGGRNINTGEYQGDGRNNPNKSGLVPGFVISPEERQALIDFLHSLTDEGFIYNADFSNPFGN
jgi:cytochrome c peroxidase